MRAPVPSTILAGRVGSIAMRKSIALAIVCCLATFVAADGQAFAQAGSTGGTIGKTDKSASGGENSTRPSNRSRPTTASGCSVAGAWLWKWQGQTTVVTLNGDGTATATNANSGSWTCTGRTVVIHWIASTDTLVLSSDGKSLTGSTTGAGGVSISGKRL